MRFLFGCLILLFFSNTVCSQDEISIAKDYLIKKSSDIGISLKNENLVLNSSHISKKSGLKHLYFNQAVNGIKIYNAITNVAVDANGHVFYSGNRFIEFKTADQINPQINALRAVKETARHFNLDENNQTTRIKTEPGAALKTNLSNVSLSEKEIVAQLVYVQQKDQLILCWSVALEKSDDHFFWDVKISAATGEYIEKTSWTLECNFGSSEDTCDHATHAHSFHEYPTPPLSNKKTASAHSVVIDGDYTVIPLPFESPSHGPISVVNSPWNDNLDANAHPFDWHNDGNTTYYTTRGNNVWAVEDANNNNGHAQGFSPDSELGTSGQQYNFIPDFSLAPQDYQEAAITNLFYWNNITHDIMYHYGFDEDAGNFQETHTSGASGSGDAVLADAQDGSGINNANFSTPTDGTNPRMQMFQWGQSPVTVFSVLSPYTANYDFVEASFGPTAIFSGSVVEIDDASGGSHEACTTNPISNGAALNGNIALIDRGNCTFVEKVTNAENEGAIAVVICNNVSGPPSGMSGTGPTIPTVMISQSDCATLRSNLPATIDVKLGAYPVGNRDSDYDNGIIIHEYGHGVSIRLTGGKSNSGCLSNAEQMGEGWSDYFGLIFTIEPGDEGTDPRGIGSYVLKQGENGPGIRPYEYSTDFAVNPMTYGLTNSGTLSIPHGIGSVWCTMLWEMTWDLVDIYGIGTNIYDSDFNNAGTIANPSTFGGQNLALQLVIEALKLQPCSPGFVDGRDAIIAADLALYGGIHECTIRESFRKRGLGFGADQGSSSALSDNVESFNTISLNKSVNSDFITSGSSITYTIDVIDEAICGAESNFVITDILDPALTISSMVCPSPAVISNSGNTVTITHPGMAGGVSFSCDIIVIAAPTGGALTTLFSDDVESGNIGWTLNNIEGDAAEQWSIVNSAANSPSNSWFITNTDTLDRTHALESPSLALGLNPTLKFFHNYDTEAGWDGGFIELSIDNGNSWDVLEASAFIQNGYNGSLGTNDNTYINGKPAWTGNSNGFIETVALLSEYSNQNVQIRFVFGQDDNTNAIGWWVDDITVTLNELALIKNKACIVSDQSLIPTCSEADVIIEFVDCEPGMITLTSTKTDINCQGEANGVATVIPDGGLAPYSYAWSNGDVTQTTSNLEAGVYSVTVSDTNLCEAEIAITISEPSSRLTFSLSYLDAGCFGTATGSINVTPGGGTSPYTFDWDIDGSGDFDDTEDLFNLTAGGYSITVMDANGCTKSNAVVLSEEPEEYTLANGNMLSGNQLVNNDYEVDGSIESDQILSSGLVVDYDSGTDITLNAGFEVLNSTVFTAFIDGCGGAQ